MVSRVDKKWSNRAAGEGQAKYHEASVHVCGVNVLCFQALNVTFKEQQVALSIRHVVANTLNQPTNQESTNAPAAACSLSVGCCVSGSQQTA